MKQGSDLMKLRRNPQELCGEETVVRHKCEGDGFGAYLGVSVRGPGDLEWDRGSGVGNKSLES